VQNERSQEVIRTVFLPALAAHGFTDGRNLAVEMRAGTSEQLPGAAVEMLARHPDVLLASGRSALAAARNATTTVPIVSFGASPTDLGYARSISQPGTNITGVVHLTRELDAKRLELVLGAVPSARRVAVLINPTSPGVEAIRRELGEVAAKSGTELLTFEATGPPDYAGAFARISASGASALVIAADPQFFSDAALLTQFALKAALPTVCQWREMAVQGCLLSYGPSYRQIWHRTALYVSLILKGASPSNLPIEQPTFFELVVNAATARSIGITVPISLLARADEVIE
jgi:ABC-type uncharacterized transport system substrate-binding protein